MAKPEGTCQSSVLLLFFFFYKLNKVTTLIFNYRYFVAVFNKTIIPLALVGYIYMLFAGWEVRIVKNCDRGLENAARGRRPRAAFSRPRSQFFTTRTDPKPVNKLFIVFFFSTKNCFNFCKHKNKI